MDHVVINTKSHFFVTQEIPFSIGDPVIFYGGKAEK
jgi:hypothetical protein